MEKKTVKIREDLHKIVSKIRFEEVGNSKYKRMACCVHLFDGRIVEFRDKDNLYNLLLSFVEAGDKDIVVSVKLVEEERKASSVFAFDFEEDEKDINSNTYICVLYTLANGQIMRLFPAEKYGRQLIDNKYKQFKNIELENLKKIKEQKSLETK